MQNLSLQVGKVDDVPVNQANRADTGCRQIEPRWRAKSSGSDQKYFGLAQLELAFSADVLQDDMAAVSLDLLFGQFHCKTIPCLFHDIQFDGINDHAFLPQPCD